MKTGFAALAVFCICCTTPAPGGDLALRNNREVAGQIDLLERWIQAKMEYDQIPGLAIAVVHDSGLVWSRGFGYANLERRTPVTPKSVFRIASNTKTFTATAIMILRDEGKLSLDDPVVKQLPWFTYRNRFAEAAAVTIRQLLTHTSGLPREAAFPYWTDYKAFPTRDQLREAFHEQESVFEPETRLKYSNLGIAILGEVVAAVSGESYEDFVARRIFTPLGMTQSSVFPSPQQRTAMVTGYGRRMPDGSRKVSDFMDSKGIAPAANISSTVEDMARYAAFHMQTSASGTKGILKPSTLREMHRVHWLQPAWRSGWGLGFSVWKTDERELYGHGGWVGGNRSALQVSPREKVAVVVMINADDGDPSAIAQRAMSMLAPAIAKAAAKPEPVPTPDPSWQLYVGSYADPDGWETEVFIMDGKLVMYGHAYPTEDNPAGSLVELVPEGKHVFRSSGENGSGERVVFEIGSDGRVRSVKDGENFVYPVR